MKRIRTSLTARLIIWFVVVQSIVSVGAMFAALFFWQQPGDEYAFAHMHVSELAVEAMKPGPDGAPRLISTPALQAFQAERPSVRIAALQGRRPLPGSSPLLVEALARADFPDFINASFRFTGGPLAGSTAVATAVDTRWGPVVVVATDNRLRLADIPALTAYMANYLVRVMVIVLLSAALIVPFVIRGALRPLQAASRDAARIDLRSRDLRLPDGDGVPSELIALVRSINAALARLDEGFSRQQRFTAEAAHELRTPLAVLAARIDSQSESDATVGMRRDVERMRTLVDQLLFIARLERQDMRRDEQLDLVALARDVVADCTPLAIGQGRRLALTPEVERLPVRASRLALESALSNLIQNAVRAEPPGGTVDVVVRAPAEILVIDHGAGISPAERERVFEPFWRRDEAHTGAGLGLAIVTEAAVAHGGGVSIAETPGGGATFRFKLRS